MKKISILSLALLLGSLLAHAAEPITFEDQVRNVQESANGFDVTFHRMAAFYHLPAQKADLAKVLQNGKDQSFQLSVDPESMEILSAKPVSH